MTAGSTTGEVSSPAGPEIDDAPAPVAPDADGGRASSGLIPPDLGDRLRRRAAGVTPVQVVLAIGLGLWTLAFLGVVVDSLGWPVRHDATLMEYTAWLIRRGYTPYRDVFEMNMPGTYAFHTLGQMVFGDTDGSFYLRSALLFGGFALGVRSLLRCFGTITWVVAVLLVGTAYVVLGGPEQALQRDWVLVVAQVIGLGIVVSADGRRWRLATGGAVLMFAMFVKPQAVLFLGVVALAVVLLGVGTAGQRQRADGVADDDDDPDPRPYGERISHAWSSGSASARDAWRPRLVSVAWMAAGATLVVVAIAAWLFATGAVDSFRFLTEEYLPNYSNLDGAGREVGTFGEAARRSLDLTLANTEWVRVWPTWLALVAVLSVPWRRQREQRNNLVLLATLLVYGFANAVLGVKQWDYHYWPFRVAALLLAAVVLGDIARIATRAWSGRRPIRASWLPSLPRPVGMGIGVVLTIALLAGIVTGVQDSTLRMDKSWADDLSVAAGHKNVLDAAAWLAARKEPGDTVVVLDLNNGGNDIAHRAGLEPATSFIYDFHFFHHEGSSATTALRERIIREFDAYPPRWILFFDWGWGRSGPKRLDSFPELTERMEGYEPVETFRGLTILERIDG